MFTQADVMRLRGVRIVGPRFLPVTETFPHFGDRKYQIELPFEEYFGKVTIQQGKKAESYLLEEDAEWLSQPGHYGRSFLFARITGKVTDRANGFYRVTVPPGWKTYGCECTGYGVHKLCKHGDALLDLHLCGLLGDPQTGGADDGGQGDRREGRGRADGVPPVLGEPDGAAAGGRGDPRIPF